MTSQSFEELFFFSDENIDKDTMKVDKTLSGINTSTETNDQCICCISKEYCVY